MAEIDVINRICEVCSKTLKDVEAKEYESTTEIMTAMATTLTIVISMCRGAQDMIKLSKVEVQAFSKEDTLLLNKAAYDFNEAHPDWVEPLSNLKGISLEEILIAKAYEIGAISASKAKELLGHSDMNKFNEWYDEIWCEVRRV
jgi:hypothetical protein